jgi:two-component system, LytTR family, response regulator
MSAELRIVIVDDEPLVRRGIRASLAHDATLAIVGECGNGVEAVAMLLDERPDVVLLDVQMPLLDGFGVLDALGEERPPAVIFVTAFDQYAVRAFTEHAVDYLLKPFDDARLLEAIGRVRIRRDIASHQRAISGLLAARDEAPQRFAVRIGSRVRVVPLSAVDWFEAADNYVALHTGDGQHLVRETLSALEARLPPTAYARTHRSAIVTLDRVREWKVLASGDAEIRLASGETVPLSRSYRDAFLRRMNASGAH